MRRGKKKNTMLALPLSKNKGHTETENTKDKKHTETTQKSVTHRRQHATSQQQQREAGDIQMSG